MGSFSRRAQLHEWVTPSTRIGKQRQSDTILDLGTRWRRMVTFTPWPLYPRRNRSRCPLNRRLGGLQSRSGRCGGRKILTLPGFERGTSRPYSSAILTELSRFLNIWKVFHNTGYSGLSFHVDFLIVVHKWVRLAHEPPAANTRSIMIFTDSVRFQRSALFTNTRNCYDFWEGHVFPYRLRSRSSMLHNPRSWWKVAERGKKFTI
jgi:hypothetical protein